MRWLFIVTFACIAIAKANVTLEVIFPADSTPLRGPQGFAAGILETLYIADTGNNRLVALDSTGKIIHESSQGGSAGGLKWPEDVAVGAGGKVFVADAGNRRIVEYSRLLEWKGDLLVKATNEQLLAPRKICLSPGGDLFVYERDEGELLRYDPYFLIATRLTSQSGQYLASPIAALEYSSPLGVLWIEENSVKIFQSDPFLSDVRTFPFVSTDSALFQLAAFDSLLFVSTSTAISRTSPGKQDSVLFSTLGRTDIQLKDLLLEAVSPTRLYLLDRRNGSLYRLNWP